MNNIEPDKTVIDIALLRDIKQLMFDTGLPDAKDSILYDKISALIPKPKLDERYPGVGVGMFVIRPGIDGQFQFLLMHRKNDTGWGDGQWSLPGGKIDWMEDAEEAARRETYEETGLVVRGDLMKLGYTNDKWPEHNKHYITLYFAGRASHDVCRVMEPSKCDDMRWVSIDSIGGREDNLFTGIKQIKNENYMAMCSAYSTRD